MTERMKRYTSRTATARKNTPPPASASENNEIEPIRETMATISSRTDFLRMGVSTFLFVILTFNTILNAERANVKKIAEH